MSMKNIFVLNCLFLLIIQRVQNADVNHATQWTVKLRKRKFDKKRYIMIAANRGSCICLQISITPVKSISIKIRKMLFFAL
jgi:hypothetical protein